MAQIFGQSSGGSNGSNTFDQIYVTHNSSGNNIQVGDDAWIGDVDAGNQFAVIGVQDSSQGGIIFGDAKTAYIQGSVSDLNIGASQTVTISANAAPGWINLTAYEGAYINGINPNNKILTALDVNFANASFYDMNSFGPYSANAEQAVSFESTAFANGIHIGGINNSQLVIEKSGNFNFDSALQFYSTGATIVYVWIKKNGTTLGWTGKRFTIAAGNFTPITFSHALDVATNDYIEIFWSAVGSTVKLESVTGLSGTKATIPSAAVTISQIG